ncbi:uncharacterized protein LOC144035633 isoform X2 [Vanacampus margaritifer]
MDDFWSTQQFSNSQRPSFHLLPVVGSPQQYESQEKDHVTSFLTARRSINTFDWLESGEKTRSLDDAEAGFYSNGNWEVYSGQSLNPAASKWNKSNIEPQSWDFGSSCETPSPLSEASWFQPTPLSQMGAPQTLPSLNLPQNSAGFIQKLDPLLESVLSQPRRSVPESHRPVWGAGDSEKFFNPNTCSPFPLSHLESSVLSPPLTPLPPPAHSPAMTCTQSHSHGGDDNGALHFFASNPQPLPSLNSLGVMWTFPAGLDATVHGNPRSSHIKENPNLHWNSISQPPSL